MPDVQQTYDVVIAGGGLAGLTLALQLKRERPQTSVCVFERRKGPAPEAAFKVGESTVEVGADYFARICGMQDHLDQDELPKAGLRFFFPAGENRDITQRVEWGDAAFAPIKTYQLDRGRFENELAERCRAHGVDVRSGCRVEAIELGGEEHSVTASREGTIEAVAGRWVIDAAGRSFLLKRKLGLEKDVAHEINSCWFRLGGGLLDFEEWGAHDEAWMARMERPGIRKHSTTHLTGEGYWVWLIPLASGSHSIGIVADPHFHPFERIATLDAAMEWLREHEPQLAEAVESRRNDVQDFLKIRKYSHGCTRVFSPERWCVTGESGVFLDPLYSPGSDFIAMSNLYVADLIKRDLDGESVAERTEIYNRVFLFQFEGVLDLYFNHYAEFGDAEVFSAKLAFDYTAYWSSTAPRVYYDNLCDLEFQQAITPYLLRARDIVRRTEQLLRDWHALGQPPDAVRKHVVPSRFNAMWDRLLDLGAGLDRETLRSHYQTNVETFEGIAVVLFHKAAQRLPGRPPDPERPVNPLMVSLDPQRWEADGLFDESGLTLAQARGRTPGIESMLIDELPTH